MKYIIYILILGGAFILTRTAFFKAWVLTMVRKFRSKKEIEKMPERLEVFSPAGTKRTFIVAMEITEIGDGTVSIEVVKKKKEVL